MARIFIFGSSSAYGYHDSLGGWSGRLKQTMSDRILRGERPAPNVINLAAPARLLSTIVERDLPFAGQEPHTGTKIGLFLVGPADSRVGPGNTTPVVPPDYFKALLGGLGDLCTRQAIYPMFVGSSPIDEAKTTPFEDTGDTFRNDSIREYDSMVATFAQSRGYPYIPVHNQLSSPAYGNVIADDGLHLNDAGHRVVHYLVQGHVDAFLAARHAGKPVLPAPEGALASRPVSSS